MLYPDYLHRIRKALQNTSVNFGKHLDHHQVNCNSNAKNIRFLFP